MGYPVICDQRKWKREIQTTFSSLQQISVRIRVLDPHRELLIIIVYCHRCQFSVTVYSLNSCRILNGVAILCSSFDVMDIIK